MRKVWLIAMALWAGPALGADVIKAAPYAPVPMPYSWSGWYIGGYMGDGFSSFPLAFGSNNATVNALSPGVIGPANSALLAGGEIGGMYQAGTVVFGAELQGGFTGFNSNMSGVANIIQTQSSVPWDIAILARFGITPSPRVLLYATAGGEGAEIDHNITVNAVCGPAGGCSASNSNVHFGWTAGVGAEWAPEFVAPFRVGMEYRYVDVGTTAVNLTLPVGVPVTVNSSDTARWNQVVVRAIYPF